MKKLMTMIAAVATAFGLYAADSHYYATSFEADVDNGCTTGPLTFNLETAGWTAGTTTETSLDLGTYESGEGYNYAGGTDIRRTFTGGAANSNYLKLETGSSTVGVLLDKTDIFIDQTVKFTGFEEVPAADAIDGQIAIWAKAIEADAESHIDGETNLCARVGNGTTYTDVNIDLDASLGDFDPSKWYRLTIKSIGNVFDSGLSQAGFLIYINGKPATTSVKYNQFAESFNTNAKRYYDKGQLFTGIKTDSAAFTTVAFQGIGSIDDFVTSVEAPKFAAEVEFTVAAITGATIDKVVAIDGEKEVVLTAPYAVMSGTEIKVYFKPAGGYRLDAAVASAVINNGGVINVSDQIIVVEGYATLNGVIKGEAELAAMMAGLTDGNQVVFLKDGNVTNDVDTLYSFTKNTQIVVAEGGAWRLSIMNVAAEQPGTFVAYADIANDITVAYESGDEFDIYADTIPAGITVDASDENGSVLLFAVPITVAGTLKVNSSATFAGSITLDGAGSVWSKTQLAYEGDTSIFTNDNVAQAGNEQSGYTYSLNATPTPTTGFMVILAGDTEGKVYETLAAAFEAAQAGSTIKMRSDAELTAWIGVNKNVTLDLNGKKVTGTLPEGQDALFAVNRGGTFTITDGAGGGEIDSGSVMCALKLTQTKALDYIDPATYTDDNKATLVVNGGTIKGFNYAIGGNGNPGRGNTAVTINGGTIMATAPNLDNAEKAACAIYNPQENSTLTITDGTISGYQSAVEIRAGTLAITGGTLTATAAEYAVVGNGNGPSCTGAALVISEHVTKKGITAQVQAIENATLTGVKSVAIVNPQGNTESQVTVTLGKATYNGALEFSADAIATVTKTDDAQIAAPAGYKWGANGVLCATEYVAQIGEAKYETLAAAFAAAQNNDTVEMLADVSLAANEKIVIMNKAVTLAGKFTVTAAGRAFNVQQGGTLTISKETTVIGTGKPATIFLWPYDFDSRALTDADAAHYRKAKLVVNGTVKYTTTGDEGAIASNGNDSIAGSEGVEVIINGTVINACDSALYLPGKGTCTVNDGAYIEGTYAGIQMKAVTLTVNGGTIKATSEDQTPTALWANGAKPSGCAIQMEGNTAYAGGINLTVNGGKIESVNAKAIYAYGAQEKFGTISIAGGTIKGNTGVFLLDEGMNKAIVPGTSKAQFNQDVTAFCEEGYETVKLESAEFYTVRAKQTDPIPPLPAEPTADDVNAKVDAAKFADSTVKTMIGGDPAKYTAFKTWAGTVTGGQAAVVASKHAADSYLLGQTTLLQNAPVSEIKTIAKTSDTALTLTFEIKDGANAVTVADSAKAYVQSLVKCAEDVGFATPIAATVNVSVSGTTLNAAVTLPANKPAAFMKVAK